MERLIITNGKLILPTGIEMGQTLICENGKIEQIIPNESYQPLVGDKVIDARQNYVSPGFIDMHIHGGGGHDFMDGTVEAFLGVAETHAKYGTTAMVPTTLTSTNEELMTTYRISESQRNEYQWFAVYRFTFGRTLLFTETMWCARPELPEKAAS